MTALPMRRVVSVYNGQDALRGDLVRAGAVRLGTEVIVARSLLGYRNPWARRFALRSARSLPTSLVRRVVEDVRRGASHFRLRAEPIALDEHAAIAFQRGAPVGLVAPEVEGGRGGIALVGLVPSARARGLGTALHGVGLAALRSLGAQRYEDSTDVDNVAMRRIFFRNGCREVAYVETWLVEEP